LKDLQQTAQNLNRLTDENSELTLALGQFKTQDFAAAEKDICDDVGIALAAVIRAAETNHHVLINEVRVTMLDDGDGKRWVQAVCTITR